MKTHTNYVLAPFTVLIDTREQFPYSFTGFRADARQQGKPLLIPVESVGLPTGDYSVAGYTDRIAIERKSLSDAYATFGADRERFERELHRLNQMDYAAVVIEAGWSDILYRPPPRIRFQPKAFYRSVLAWSVRFPAVHWWPCETRWFAERMTYRLLERFWLDEQRRLDEQRQGT